MTFRLLTLSLVGVSGAGFASAQPPAEPVVLRVGFEERLRTEDWNNILDMSDKTNDRRDQIRLRTRVWVDLPLTSSIEAFVSLSTEPTKKIGSPLHFSEVFFDAVYVDFHRVFVRGLDLKVGRQDIRRGEGFILFEGTPMDGSRDTYMTR
jgi:hypothetical protein